MSRVDKRLIIFIFLLAPVLFIVMSIPAMSQPGTELEPRLGEVLGLVHRAEEAGANPEEIQELVVLLNRALALNDEARRQASQNNMQQYAELLAEANTILVEVQSRAEALETTSAQRTFTNRVFTYALGAVGALLATITYHYVTLFWRRYKTKRTFQMRIILPK